MNKPKKAPPITLIVMMIVVEMLTFLFLAATTKKFLGISADVYALKIATTPVTQQDTPVKDNPPITDITKTATQRDNLIKEEKKVQTVSRSMSPDEEINAYVKSVTSKYSNVKPELVMSIIYHESRYNPRAKTGNCVGLMQVSTYWHAERAKKLRVTNFYDPRSNILVGVDYISELLTKYKDPKLVLMLYNMNHDDAIRLYNEGNISSYAKSVLSRAEKIKKGM